MGHRTLLTGFIFAAALLFAACGPDTVAPGTPTFSPEPDVVFFNTGAAGPVVLFEGRATDNRWVDHVLISFDNAATWHTAGIDSAAPNTVRDVQWWYYPSEPDMPAFINTVLLRVVDQDANETTGTPVVMEKAAGSTVGSFQAVFSAAAADDVIALSSGSGGAYGNGVTALKIPILTRLTVIGTGYGSAATSAGVTPSVASTATVIEAPLSTSAIFSVEEDFTLKKVRLVGAASGVRINDTAADVDPAITVEECLFDGQDAWALQAVDDDSQTAIEFTSSLVDASSAGSTSRGGLYLDRVVYTVSGSGFYRQTDPLGPSNTTVRGAGVQAFGGAGAITESLFEDNALAIWASGGSPVITSCDVSGAMVLTSYGINLTGGPGLAIVRRNTVDGNSGYGLRLGGTMELTLRRNAITNNEYSGVLIDSRLSNTNLTKIDMGTSTDEGFNLFDENYHPDGSVDVDFETQVYVTIDTSEGSTRIPANWNYWGVQTSPQVNYVIIDGNDNPARATLAIGGIFFDDSEVGP
jgi:hypothetical protein